MNTIKNNVTLMGHLGADPEYKKLDSGKALLKLRLATNEVYKNKEGERTSTTHWHNCVAWGRQAEVMKDLLKKGKEVIVQGKLQYRTYKDSNGVEKKISEIVVQEFSLTGKKEDS
jgi:single-strand DNA-binding protein